MENDIIIETISVYKIIVNSLRIVAGIVLLLFVENPIGILGFLLRGNFLEYSRAMFFDFILRHIHYNSAFLTYTIALSLIILSSVELVFIIALLYRKRWGAVGFFIITLLWIPIEIIFLSRFLIFSRTISLLIDALILVLLFKLLTHSKKYFRR
jgi:hypothetical protein